jgi:hypothetical protein
MIAKMNVEIALKSNDLATNICGIFCLLQSMDKYDKLAGLFSTF